MPAVISLRKVTRKYQVGEQSIITPIKDISLELEQGEFIMIIGRSGSGKTTLLNLAAGLIKPTSGEVLIGDVKLSSLSDKKLSILRNKKIGFIFQYPSLLPSLTALENVALPLFLASLNGSNPYDQAQELLDLVGLKDKHSAFPRNLSSGEQRRVVIARALIN